MLKSQHCLYLIVYSILIYSLSMEYVNMYVRMSCAYVYLCVYSIRNIRIYVCTYVRIYTHSGNCTIRHLYKPTFFIIQHILRYFYHCGLYYAYLHNLTTFVIQHVFYYQRMSDYAGSTVYINV